MTLLHVQLFESKIYVNNVPHLTTTVEPLLRGHPFERPPPLERPLDNVKLNMIVLIPTPDKRPPLLKGHFSSAKGVASQEGFHCIRYFSCFQQLYFLVSVGLVFLQTDLHVRRNWTSLDRLHKHSHSMVLLQTNPSPNEPAPRLIWYDNPRINSIA